MDSQNRIPFTVFKSKNKLVLLISPLVTHFRCIMFLRTLADKIAKCYLKIIRTIKSNEKSVNNVTVAIAQRLLK
jgi:hypothetical protein